jgi:TetR/AcrR family transcriptional regulator, cholesterol catabolism regulator
MAMTPTPHSADTDRFLDAVLELIESEGCENLSLRQVAEQTRASLATIYKYYPSRDELIVAAMEHWMEANVYLPLTSAVPTTSLYDKLMWLFHHVFDPWERNPRMLDAFMRARAMNGGERLYLQGQANVAPVGTAVYEGLDPSYAEDLDLILTNVTFGALYSFVVGHIGAGDILPIIERAVRRLVESNETATGHGGRRNGRPAARAPRSSRTRS